MRKFFVYTTDFTFTIHADSMKTALSLQPVVVFYNGDYKEENIVALFPCEKIFGILEEDALVKT